MLRKLLLLGFCLMPAIAVAQAPQLSPQDEALQQEIIALEGAKLNWQAQAITEKRRADDLQKQIDALKKAATPAK
jgi:hypothetical protein